jgi:hypothetical protein
VTAACSAGPFLSINVDGFAVWACFVNGLRTERDRNALTAVLNVVESTLDHTPDRWEPSDPFTALVSALRDLSRRYRRSPPGPGTCCASCSAAARR